MGRHSHKDIEELARLITVADAVIAGAGSRLSNAAGFNHFHWPPALETYLGEFKDYYRSTSPFAGFYYCASSLEQQWEYYTNVDMQCERVFFMPVRTGEHLLLRNI